MRRFCAIAALEAYPDPRLRRGMARDGCRPTAQRYGKAAALTARPSRRPRSPDSDVERTR
ncbi:hypothetical protein Misp05_13470 [Micromonospora sp. NBRC 107095]|nr:hypothetical protein Misp05_13470 [Micromonospora sp. NBRC 107095]